MVDKRRAQPMYAVQPKNNIQRACLEGAVNAFELHYKWSGGWLLGYAPESLIQSEIARCLSEVCPFVTLEGSVDEILRDSEASSRGSNFRAGRFDIVTWSAKDKPYLLIEIKKAWWRKVINEDVIRLKKVLKRGGTTRGGLVVVYTSAKKEKTINNRIIGLKEESETTMACRIGPQERDGVFWDVACFSVR